MMQNADVTVEIKRLDPAFDDLPLPRYMTPGSVGADLYAALSEPLTLSPGKRVLVPSGIAIAVPNGYEAQVRPRSGLAWKNGVTVLNTPGTIDSDYRGEVKVILINLGEEDFIIQRGERIAQMIIAPIAIAEWQQVAELSETSRSAGGFGHTGNR